MSKEEKILSNLRDEEYLPAMEDNVRKTIIDIIEEKLQTKTKMSKKIIKDPFMGEIELTKLGETSKHMMGESRIDTIYTDDKENIWVDTWATTGSDPIPMTFLRKDLVDLIIELNQNNE